MDITHIDKEYQPPSSVLFISRETRRDLEHILNTVNNLSPVLNPESFEARSSIAFYDMPDSTITMNQHTV